MEHRPSCVPPPVAPAPLFLSDSSRLSPVSDIFSGGGESAHPLWAGWGLSSEDHKAKRAEMATAMAERRALIDTEWQLKAEARRAEILADQKKQDIERKERLEKATVAYQAQSAKVTLIRQTIQDPVVLAQTLLTENATLQHLNGVYRIASAPISANLWLVQAVLSQWWEELLGLESVSSPLPTESSVGLTTWIPRTASSGPMSAATSSGTISRTRTALSRPQSPPSMLLRIPGTLLGDTKLRSWSIKFSSSRPTPRASTSAATASSRP